MLIDFKVANFRSIAEPLTFSMQGSKASKASIETGSNAVSYLLRAAAIFGANVSGKTNLLMDADVIQRLLSGDRKSVVSGRSMSVRVELGDCRRINKIK